MDEFVGPENIIRIKKDKDKDLVVTTVRFKSKRIPLTAKDYTVPLMRLENKRVGRTKVLYRHETETATDKSKAFLIELNCSDKRNMYIYIFYYVELFKTDYPIDFKTANGTWLEDKKN